MTESSTAAPHLQRVGAVDDERQGQPDAKGRATRLAAPATWYMAVAGIRAAVERTPLDQPVLIVNEPIPSAGHAPYFGGWADIYTIYFRRPLDRPILFIDRDALWWYGALGDSPLTRLLVPPPVRLPLTCTGT